MAVHRAPVPIAFHCIVHECLIIIIVKIIIIVIIITLLSSL